jgi:hypothetical protein
VSDRRRIAVKAPRIAGSYDYKEPRTRDVFDKFTAAPDRWVAQPDPTLSENRSKKDRKPVTPAELDAYFERSGVATLSHPKEAQRNRNDARRAEREDARAGITKQQWDWAHKFEPLAGVPKAVLVVKEHLELIKPTARRNVVKWTRIKAAVRAIGWDGLTRAEFALNEKLDQGQLSRLLSDAYKRYPKLEPALKLLNLLNQQTKRRVLSTPRVSCLLGEEDRCVVRWKSAEVLQQIVERPGAVKFYELIVELLQPARSSFPITAAIEAAEHVSVGTQRVADDAKDYKATLWDHDHDRWHDAIDRWHRLRAHVGLSKIGKLDLGRALPIAERFFQLEELRQAIIDALPIRPEFPTTATPYALHRCRMSAVYVDAPSRDPGYLGPVGREVRRPPTTWTGRVLHSYRMLALSRRIFLTAK